MNLDESSSNLQQSQGSLENVPIPPPPPPPSEEGIFGGVMNIIRSNVPIAIGVALSYVIGYFKLNVIWIISLFLLIWRIHLLNYYKGYEHYKNIHISQKNESKHSIAKAKDSSEWLNLLIAAVFPNITDLLDTFTKDFMNNFLSNLVKTLQPIDPTQPKPSFIIDSITVKKVSFGVIAPTIDYIKSLTVKKEKLQKENPNKKKGFINKVNPLKKKNKDKDNKDTKEESPVNNELENSNENLEEKKVYDYHYKMDCTFNYAGDITLELVVKVGTQNLKLKLPVVVDNVNLTAEMHIGCIFQKGESWFPAKALEVAFRQLPANWLKFDVRAFQSLNLFDIYGVERYLLSTVDNSIKNMMLLPEMLKVDMISRASVIKKIKKKSKDIKGKRSKEIIHDNVLDKNSHYRGCMIVEIRQIKGLKQTDPITLTDAYCIVSLGRYEYRTPIVSGSLDPKFTVLFDFPLETKFSEEEKDDKDNRVLIEVFDNEKIGEHTRHGNFRYDISKWVPDTTVTGNFHFNNGKIFSPDAQIDASFTYYPDLK